LKPNNTTITVSEDGSHTIKNDLFDAYYHSIHGAIGESKVVFIDAALEYLYGKGLRTIKVFEMGFGTGLNVLMTYLWATHKAVIIDYHTVEAHPVDPMIISQLNYGHLLDCYDTWSKIHSTPWDRTTKIDDYFTLTKYHASIEDLTIPHQCQAVFYDAFSPETQAHLWQSPILNKMYNCLEFNGVLTSYCAQGEFRRQLQSCGFAVERLPGPPYKRQMIRAVK
jgi:tRNA U34 5-methylaminomethyl-2-thiouridine-forming methyltransferase MnmC